MNIGILGNSLTHDLGSGYTGTGMLGLFGHTIGAYGYGGALVVILTATIGIGVAYLVFRFGWRKVKGSTK